MRGDTIWVKSGRGASTDCPAYPLTARRDWSRFSSRQRHPTVMWVDAGAVPGIVAENERRLLEMSPWLRTSCPAGTGRQDPMRVELPPGSDDARD